MNPNSFEPVQPETADECNLLIKAAATIGNFPLGRILITPETRQTFSPPFVATCLFRHSLGDWGQVDEEDWETNNEALRDGSRILSSYKDTEGNRLWIITEWDRSVTTCLLPKEY